SSTRAPRQRVQEGAISQEWSAEPHSKSRLRPATHCPAETAPIPQGRASIASVSATRERGGAKGLLVMPCSVFRLSVVWSNGRIYRPDDVKGDLAVGLRQHQASQRGTWLRTSRTTKRMHRNPLACSPCCRGNERMPDETSCRRHI